MKLPAFLLALVVAGNAIAAERAADYDAALARAKATGQDIVVFQRGSDWNHLAEKLLADVWNQSAFAGALTNAILVVVDSPQTVGAAPVAKEPSAEAGVSFSVNDAPQRLQKLSAAMPDSALTAVASAGGATFTRQPDGSFLASGNNPGQDTLTLTVQPARGGNILRLDFPTHESLPGNSPGRANNGNFAISEIEIAGQPKPLAAWGSVTDGALGAWLAVDGITNKADSFWHGVGHHHQRRTLLVLLAEHLPAGQPATVRLVCKSHWGQHVPGNIRAAVLDDKAVAADIRSVSAAELDNTRNAKFTWRGDDIPRIAFMDNQGRPVASEDSPRRDLTPAALAARVKAMQAARVQRDALWAQAASANGPARAELLMKGLLAMEEGIPFEKIYNPIREQMKTADPSDESGCLRRMQFGHDPRGTPPLVDAAYKLVDAKKFEEALAVIDREMKHPGNRWLNHEQMQRILIGKFNIYRQWPGREEQRFEVQREIHALDPGTFWGLGAIGYLAMHKKTAEPVALVYGWEPVHLKSGVNRWTITLDLHRHFDHAGKYTLRISHGGGKDAATIQRVVLLDGGKVLCEANPAAALAPGGRVDVPLKVDNWPFAARPALRLEVVAEPGRTDVIGRFEVEPLL